MSAPRQQPPAYLHWAVLGGVLVGLLLLGFVPEVRAFVVRAWEALSSSDPAVTRAFVESLGWAGPLALIGGFIVQAVIPVIPALVLIAVTARAYGPLEGFAIVYLGTMLGAVAGYWLGRTVGNSLIRLLIGETARRKTYEFASQHGVQGVLLARLVPLVSADAINLVAGAARMPFRPFMLATLAGALPVTALVVWLSGDLHRLKVGMLALSVVVVLGVLGQQGLKRRKKLPG